MRRLPVIAALSLAVGLLVVPVTAAHAAPRVEVTNEFGKAEADTKYATKLTLRGSGFQSIKNGHGGIYVFFGTVDGRWQPSRGGTVGTNYRYVPDSETKNNQGFQKFVTFPGSDTASAANGGQLASNGTWSTSINVPGAKFQTVDRNGKAQTVDCLKETCGIITIGAHGVKNARNESFTPVSFASLYDKAPEGSSAPQADEGGAAATADEGDDTKKGDKPAKAADAEAAVDPATAVVGRVLSFTGTGFEAGEQVIATLDDGKAAVGPLSAGAKGEVAGVLQLPEDLEPGTHVLKLTGASSGAAPTVNFPIAADPALAAAESEEISLIPDWLPVALFAIALVALFGSVTFAALHVRRTRKKVKASKDVDATDHPETETTPTTEHAHAH